jgi:SAM-dependent methyltransferase
LTNTQHISNSVLFDWNLDQFDRLVALCAEDDTTSQAIIYLPKKGRILEAGCGPGHVVEYLNQRGFNVEGIELNKDVVEAMLRRVPDLRIAVGDVGSIQVPDNYYDGLLSFGVVEHFVSGLRSPLIEQFRVLAPGGIAIISVPSFNLIRRLRNVFSPITTMLNPRRNPLLRRLLNKPALKPNRRGYDNFIYHVHPRFGPFFEYRLTRTEFEQSVRDAGFTILRSMASHHFVGMWCEFGEWCVKNHDRSFRPTLVGRVVDKLMRIIPFVHNHMHIIIATKR